MAEFLRYRHHWIFYGSALAVWLAVGWPFLHELATGAVRRDTPVPALWLLPYTAFGAAILGAALLKRRTGLQWALAFAQLAAVAAMTIVFPKDLMSLFLVLVAWQVAMTTSVVKALGWVALQTLALIGFLALIPDTHLSYVLGLSFVLQLCAVFTAHTLRREAESARALAGTNRELRAAQAIIAGNVRDAERLRISRELHDAWGHELTALGLQLEIASNVGDTGRASDHVMQAKGLAKNLLGKVREVVSALREAERSDRGSGTAAGDRSAAGSAPYLSAAPIRARLLGNRHQRIFCVAALAVTMVLGWPVFWMFAIGKLPFSAPWFLAFALFGASVLGAIMLKLPPRLHWALLCVQVAAVAAMAFIASWAMMSTFLIIVAWQVAMATSAGKALGWVALQTLAVIGALALAPNPDLCWVIGKSFALQLFFVFSAQALRMEAETGRALAAANAELRSAQALIADSVRDAERLRISRELHDAWGHELTALGLQLEIASHITEPGRAGEHVMQAKGLARALLGKVRDVVATLREADRCDLKDALETLARSVPAPAVHVSISPGVRVSPDQAHALMRCAQEAVTNAIRHARADNLWLEVSADQDGVRLVARDDGKAPPAPAPSSGSGLLGMRERVESLGGRLAVQAGAGFTVDAWLPTRAPQAA